MHVIHSDSTDPFANAALEEEIFRRRPFDDEATLLFYSNPPSVHCGRNQEPAAECALSWCSRQGIPVLKRFSGGGTVYHDLGNLNYAFIVPRRLYSPGTILAMVAAALKDAGAPEPTVCERFSIWSCGAKISGSAFAISGPAAMVHGCIPFSCGLEELRLALRPEAPPPPGRYVNSVPAPVRNISELAGRPAEQCRTIFQESLLRRAIPWSY
ncbi:MAG: lipoate--protein ligase family protein [Victivallales bacterium]|nr:lipoate--protein ligase family protein [Victivallales bacterium]